MKFNWYLEHTCNEMLSWETKIEICVGQIVYAESLHINCENAVWSG